MPDDNRLDLSVDLDKIGEDLLADVKKAAEEVKSRQASDKEKEARSVEKEKNRKISTVLIAVGVIIAVVIAYFVIFSGKAQAPPPTSYQTKTPAPALKTPAATPQPAPRAMPATPAPTPQQSRPGARPNTTLPSDDYEQPKGM